MKYMNDCYQNFVAAARAIKADKSGVTALEYGLIAALIAGVIVTVVSTLGTNIKTTFSTLGSDI